MVAPASPEPLYQIDYFLGQRAASLYLFKKVDYPGRSRPEVFVLDAGHWVRASGLTPRLAGTPEWDASARSITRDEARHLMQTTGLSSSQVEALLAVCDPATAIGARDRAVVMILVRLITRLLLG